MKQTAKRVSRQNAARLLKERRWTRDAEVERLGGGEAFLFEDGSVLVASDRHWLWESRV
jgi:hypothetical protein